MLIEEDLGIKFGKHNKKIYSDLNCLIRADGLLVEYTIRRFMADISDIEETNIPIPEKQEN